MPSPTAASRLPPDHVNVEGTSLSEMFERSHRFLPSEPSPKEVRSEAVSVLRCEAVCQPCPGAAITNKVQMTFSGEEEDVQTTITRQQAERNGEMSLFRITSEIKHRTPGFIRKAIDGERRRIDFIEYLEPVDFPAYLDMKHQLILFNAPGRACRGVLSHLRKRPCGIELVEMAVDFTEVMRLRSEYLAAWFRGVSSRVQAAGLSGHQIQDDTFFRPQELATMSNVTIPWTYEDFEYSIMLTASGAVVLVQTIAGNVALELKLVMDVYERLLQHVWHERKRGDSDESCPGEP